MKTYGKLHKEVLGERQQMIMQCIWDIGGPVTIQDIKDRMKARYGFDFSKASINTLVLMLVERGYLTQGKKIHQAFTFVALISEAEFRISEISRISDFTFDGDPSEVLASMLQTRKVGKEDVIKMRELIDKYDSNG